ncbi:Sedlin [Neoconidiobolus thromboides FSU 785]|nr:Sedlin [Neoconidiobolus thromboides FSU 785]
MPKLCCIAIIGKQNNPLYIKNFIPEYYDDIKFHYLAHTSCDLFNDKALANNKGQGQYFGLLHIVEEFVVYGYITNSKIKFIAVLELTDDVIKDVEMKMLFKQIHAAYIILVCNPFYSFQNDISNQNGQLIVTKQFTNLIEQIGQTMN